MRSGLDNGFGLVASIDWYSIDFAQDFGYDDRNRGTPCRGDIRRTGRRFVAVFGAMETMFGNLLSPMIAKPESLELF